MVQIFGLIMVALVATYIAFPLLRSAGSGAGDAERDTLTDLAAQKDTLYRELADLDLDHGDGKVAEDDYRMQREEYLEEAAMLLQEIDGLSESQSSQPRAALLDQELEEEIRRLRRRTTGR